MSEYSGSESGESATLGFWEDHHTPVCWREYEYKCEDLGARGTQDALKINTLAHRSRRVILIPIMPMKDVYQSQENPFWSWISTRDTFRIEIAATPECQEAYGRPESFCFGRFGQPRLEHPWRKSVDADRLNSDHSLGENSVIDQLEPLLGPTFDTSRVDPRDLAADHPMVMWLRFDPDDMSKIILTTVPYEKDVFDYDARPESPRVWCGLCLRSIPEELFSTPCAFHPGTSRNKRRTCCKGNMLALGCVLEETHLPPHHVNLPGRDECEQ